MKKMSLILVAVASLATGCAQNQDLRVRSVYLNDKVQYVHISDANNDLVGNDVNTADRFLVSTDGQIDSVGSSTFGAPGPVKSLFGGVGSAIMQGTAHAILMKPVRVENNGGEATATSSSSSVSN